MLLGCADGVSQIEEFGIDASELPHELLNAMEELAVNQLFPGQATEEYHGPIAMVRDAYESTLSYGSTTVLTAVMDNSTRIHGKIHPMIAVCSIGDCEILILRRGSDDRLQQVFQTEMQRIGGHAQSPLQLARVDETVDPDFDEELAIEVIERGSAVHCVSAFQGDIVILGSDGVFDNLFTDEIVSICEEMIRPRKKGARFKATSRHDLGQIARRIVAESHSKTEPLMGQYRRSPIGKGGKIDDTSAVVAEVVEWTDSHADAWAKVRRDRSWTNFLSCGGTFGCQADDEDDLVVDDYRAGRYPSKPNANSFASAASGWGSFSEAGDETNYNPSYERQRDRGCSLM
jgi:protein phosphatase PTC7